MFPRTTRMLSFLGAVVWALLTNPADAQNPAQHTAHDNFVTAPQQPSVVAARSPATTVGGVLQSLALRSGVAFVGTVDSIDRQPGVVTVNFQVVQPVLGDPGPTYTLREWAGLWTLGRQRYTVGQRALFFLHAPNAAGLSSPVDGQDGIVPILPTAADQPALLDVRWLATRVLRPVGAGLQDIHTGALNLTEATTFIARARSSQPATEPAPQQLPASLRAVTVAEVQ
jgi:hypothetical protein